MVRSRPLLLIAALPIGMVYSSGGTSPYSYSWSPSADLDDASASNPTASPGITTTYTVTVTDANDTAPVVTASQNFNFSEAAGNGASVGTVAENRPPGPPPTLPPEEPTPNPFVFWFAVIVGAVIILLTVYARAQGY